MFLLAIVLQSCNLSRNIPEDKVLLKKTHVSNAPDHYRKNLESLIKQQPSRRSLGITKPYIWLYLKLDKKKETKVNAFLKRTFAEEPIYLDTSLIDKSTGQMHDYLINKGYFNSEIDYNIRYKQKKATVEYVVSYKEPYRVNDLSYFIADRDIDEIVQGNKAFSKIRKDEVFDSKKLIEERERIARLLNNNGYYKFGKNYIHFDVDTSQGEKSIVDVKVYIRNFNDSTRHKVYKVRDVYLEPDYRITDTSEKHRVSFENYILITSGKEVVKSQILERYIKVAPGRMYNKGRVTRTINLLSELDQFKFIDISFAELNEDDADTVLLDCLIRLTPMDKYDLIVDFEGNTTEEYKVITAASSRYYGVAGNVTLLNRNVLKRAANWTIRGGGALNMPVSKLEGENLFENYQFELENTIFFPSAISLDFMKSTATNRTSKTAVNLAYFFESNQDFKRATTNIGLTYQIKKMYRKYYITIPEISLVRNTLSEAFADSLELIDDPLLNNAFETHLLPAFRLSFDFNTLGRKEKDYWRIQGNLCELAGNVPWFFNSWFTNNVYSDTTPYQIWNTDFFQYLKSDLELTYTNNLNPWSAFAAHTSMGIGFPYGNSKVMPFEKRYFIGGANSLRAWPLRGLGPGSYQSTQTVSFDHTGELKFEANAEYRFDIISFIEGALFIDAGNIWTLREDDRRPGGLFEFNDFLSEIAVGSGLGLRFDFVFLILRTDFAVPVKDPSRDLADRWVLDKTQLKDFRFNVGIGYPF